MNRSRTLLVAALAATATAALAQPIKRMSYPALSPDGATLVFSWQGDLWSSPRAGGRAVRLTVHNATDTRPVWFPDGSRIAFATSRNGSFDVYTIRPDGSDLKRVTYDGGAEYPNAVSTDGRMIFGHTTTFGRGDLFRVGSEGGDLVRLTDHPLEAAYLARLSPDGATVYYNRGAYRETAWQKPGTVSASLPEIWAADNTVPLTNHRRLTQNETTDLTPTPTTDGSVIYISSQGGWPNVWRAGRDLKGGKKLTNHTNGTSRNPSASRDGRFVAYEFESDVYLLDTKSGADTKLNIEVPADSRINPRQEVTVATLNDYDLSPDGRRLAIESRGDLFLTLDRGGPSRRLTTNPSVDAQPTWLDAKTILYTASENGKRVLKTVDAQGDAATWKSDARDLMHPTVSPDGKSVAFLIGDDTLAVADAKGAGERTVLRANLRGALDGARQYSWSPDSRYLAVDKIQGRRREIVLVEVATGKQTVVGRAVFKPQVFDTATPVWLPNGKGLLIFSPEYDDTDLYLIDLVPADVTFSEDELDRAGEPATPGQGGGRTGRGAAGAGATATPEPPKVEVYEPGILQRMRRLTTGGAISAAVSPDSRTIYASTPEGIVSINAATGGSSAFLPNRGGGLTVRNGRLYFGDRGVLNFVTLGGPATATPVAFSSTFTTDTGLEEKALFEDIWWAIDRLYYDAKLNNKDWAAIRAKYAELVPYAYDRQDFYRLMGEMMEELDSSHLGATAPPAPDWGSGNESPAFLGVDFDPKALAQGRYVVGRVIPNTPATSPSSLLQVGDRILTIDGVPLSEENPVASLLNRKSGRKVTLEIERGAAKRTVAIKPASATARTDAEYEAFVEKQREMTERLSGGRLGYLHIRGMDQPSLQRFLREIRTEGEGKEGMIVDVRFNGGGSTAVDILGVLVRTPWLIRTTRGEFGTRLSENIYRSDALELPTALMINTASFSNAEVIAEGWRKLKLGPIVGEPTPGYVIGTGGYRLWDGGLIRMPSIGAYAVSGENLEGVGRKPDTTVWFDPNAWAAGRDPQLEKTVSELIKTLPRK